MLARIRVVLVRPRRGGNVGSVARAMKNMGLADLVLVAPRTPVGASAERMAAHAGDVLQRRRVVRDLPAAVRDCHLVVGTVGRTTTGPAEPIAARSAGSAIAIAARRGRVALVFGPEDHGLSNAELDLCQMLVRIPTAEAYGSLNLAQAVLVCAYEIHLAARSRAVDPRDDGRGHGASGESDRRPATSGEREALVAHLADALDRIGFLSRQNPAHILRDVRSLLARASLTARDVRIWRGIARQMLWAGGRAESARARPGGRVNRRAGSGSAPA
ncbi:MAG TPA: RNA methyltransferase [Candidatus Binatia bacterium]|nr:RNA methyltransferase [Candidatus Binatia bacterium]